MILGASACINSPEQNQPIHVIYQPLYAQAFRIVEIQGDTLIEVLKNNQVIQRTSCKKKPQSTAVFSTTHVHYLSHLNLQHALVATVYGERIQDEIVKNRIANQQCINWSNKEVSREQIAVCGAQGLLTLPYENRNWSEIFPEIPVLPMFEYEETHPLGRAEWLVAVGFFFGKSNQSIDAFKQIEKKYSENCVQADTQQLKIAVLAFDGNAWTIAPNNSFWSVLMSNAGATYLGCEGSKSQSFDFEQVVQLLENADMYFEVNYRENDFSFEMNDLSPKLQRYLQSKNKVVVGCNTAINGFFGCALLEPDVLLQEIRNCLNNKENHPKYFQKLNSAN